MMSGQQMVRQRQEWGKQTRTLRKEGGEQAIRQYQEWWGEQARTQHHNSNSTVRVMVSGEQATSLFPRASLFLLEGPFSSEVDNGQVTSDLTCVGHMCCTLLLRQQSA